MAARWRAALSNAKNESLTRITTPFKAEAESEKENESAAVRVSVRRRPALPAVGKESDATRLDRTPLATDSRKENESLTCTTSPLRADAESVKEKESAETRERIRSLPALSEIGKASDEIRWTRTLLVVDSRKEKESPTCTMSPFKTDVESAKENESAEPLARFKSRPALPAMGKASDAILLDRTTLAAESRKENESLTWATIPSRREAESVKENESVELRARVRSRPALPETGKVSDSARWIRTPRAAESMKEKESAARTLTAEMALAESEK